LDIVGLDHVQLAMPPGGEEKARWFYAGVLGLTEVEKPESLQARGGCWFTGEGTQIHLGVQADFVPATKAHPALRVANLDEAVAALETAGVAAKPDTAVPHVRRFYAHDPFGNRLEFIQLESIGKFPYSLEKSQRYKVDSQKRAELREKLVRYLDRDEIRDLCFDLGIDYEDLPGGERKSAKIRALISHMEKRLILSELVDAVRKIRPKINLPQFPILTSSVEFEIEGEVKTEGDSILMTGFTDLDSLMNGLQKGNLVTIASVPSLGKTSFVTTVAYFVANRYQKEVVFFSLQHPRSQIWMRLIASLIRIDTRRLFRNEIEDHERVILDRANSQLKKSSITIFDGAFLTLEHLRNECHKIRSGKGIDMLIVDGLELIHSENRFENLDSQVSESVRWLKSLAMELNVPVVTTAQLNFPQRYDKHPMLTDLNNGIEKFADDVIFKYRDDYFYPEETSRPNIAEIYVAKQSNGQTGVIDLYWDRLATFKNLIRQEINL